MNQLPMNLWNEGREPTRWNKMAEKIKQEETSLIDRVNAQFPGLLPSRYGKGKDYLEEFIISFRKIITEFREGDELFFTSYVIKPDVNPGSWNSLTIPIRTYRLWSQPPEQSRSGHVDWTSNAGGLLDVNVDGYKGDDELSGAAFYELDKSDQIIIGRSGARSIRHWHSIFRTSYCDTVRFYEVVPIKDE
jgi:hypothetical protein